MTAAAAAENHSEKPEQVYTPADEGQKQNLSASITELLPIRFCCP